MAQSAAASGSLPVPHTDNRQARLDAAIALFRSEASASGYVVEEVRLRLPVPDVEVMPRVIIAQQTGSATTPPIFPRSKHPRPMSSYPSAPSSDRAAPAPMCEQPYSTLTKTKAYRVPVKPMAKSDTKSGSGPGRGAGFKRTVSGSVIFHPVPARTASSKREVSNSGNRISQAPHKNGPLSSIPYLPTKDSSSSGPKNAQNGPKNVAFWKTVIGSEKGKAILRAAESMHRMRHGANGPKFVSPMVEEDTAKMEVDSLTRYAGENSDTTERKSETRAKETPRQAEERTAENTLHINGHNIPESHVQLLLSSAADISAREQKSAPKKIPDSATKKNSRTDDKKMTAGPQVIVNRNPSGTKAIPVSNGKRYCSKARRDSSDRHHSRSSAARPFKCHKCPSSFDRDGHLRVHILAVHEKKRPFVCQVCDASFGHSSSLLRHVRTVHQASPAVGSGKLHLASSSGQKSNDSGTTKSEDLCEKVKNDTEKHFRCSACGQVFHRVALLNRHVANRHPLQFSSPQESDDTREPP